MISPGPRNMYPSADHVQKTGELGKVGGTNTVHTVLFNVNTINTVFQYESDLTPHPLSATTAAIEQGSATHPKDKTAQLPAAETMHKYCREIIQRGRILPGDKFSA